ncbi:hypothetical protein LR48_Vigan01g029400 [Vigna angularis]|uniref:Uncharacterized protein n=1 Tax=Phaseolus angularis TaxID=3914 RepID=A0A0L9TKP8_PHAAN|nr:hypothetical protein LR48_Vigan01g029400 [Vigna angularis]
MESLLVPQFEIFSRPVLPFSPSPFAFIPTGVRFFETLSVLRLGWWFVVCASGYCGGKGADSWLLACASRCGEAKVGCCVESSQSSIDLGVLECEAQALGRAIHVDEVFAQTHVWKGTNEFVDERSRKTHEEFSTRLSQVKSEHGSAPTPDDASNAEDDIHRTQCWVDIVGGKKKGRVYGAGQLAANYTTSRGGTLKHQPSFSTTTADEAVVRLTQALEQRDQEITDLIAEFRNFKALIMRVLPETSQDQFIIPPTQPRPSLSPVVPQQPTSIQPSSVQPTSVQPTPVQPSTEEHDDEDHSDDNYVHY